MPNQKKIQIVEQVTDKFTRARSAFFTDYKGINVELINQLRQELYNAKIDYQVVKKTLLRVACQNTGRPYSKTMLTGQTGVAFAYDDPALPGRVITEFIKKNKLTNLNITGCLFENELFSADKIEYIINLPTRDELLATLLATLNAPLGRLVATFAAPLSQLVGVLKSLQDKKE